MGNKNPVHITIVGGGLVGASLAEMLVDYHTSAQSTFSGRASAPEISISIVDPLDKIGQGIPYKSVAADKDLDRVATNNQPNNRMGYTARDPDALSAYLNPKDPASVKNEFAKRRDIGQFASERFNQRATELGPEALRHVKSSVNTIERDEQTGKFHLSTAGGETLASDVVIVADGHQYTNSMNHLAGNSQFFGRYDDLDRAADLLKGSTGSVVIRGTSQSMVDWLRVLDHVGFQGNVHAVSRRGYMPWTFDPLEHPVESDNIPYALHFLSKDSIANGNHSLTGLNELLDKEIERARNSGLGRAHVYSMAIRELAPLTVDASRQDKDLSTFFNYLTAMYGNPTPEKSSTLINDMSARGQLNIVKTDLNATDIIDAGNGFTFAEGSKLSGLKAKAVFDAAIFARDAIEGNGHVRSPLLAQLHQAGTLKVDPESARVFSAGVQKIAGLYLANGPATSLYKWGIESFRGKNDQIAEEIIQSVWEQSHDL